MGNGLTESWAYNTRMQPLSVTATNGSTALTLKTWYCPGTSPTQDCTSNNGNILQSWIAPSATTTHKQTFGYDSVNRLNSASEGTAWSQTYGYGAYGNLWVAGTGPGIDPLTPASPAWYSAATNHLVQSQIAYDTAGAGNVATMGGYAFVFDGENRMVASSLNGTTTAYAYDGEGRRVRKTTGGGATTLVYDAQGHLVAEYGPTPAGVPTVYLTADHLGSTRMTTDASGNPIDFHDYAPFGDEIPAGVDGRGSLYGSADGVNVKFTGKLRDTETSLDYFGARYFSGAQGRFTSPDPLLNSGRPWEPQSWNRYAYVLNNPLRFTDPNGLWDWGACKAGKAVCAAYQQRFTEAVDRARQAAQHYKEGSKERAALDKVLAVLGTANDKNGLKIAFGSLAGMLAGYSAKTNTITFDLPKLDNLFLTNPATRGYDRQAELAGTAIHEPTHKLDHDSGLLSSAVQPGKETEYLLREYQSEENAYGNESLVFEGLNKPSINGLWNPSWAEADRETLRQQAVQREAQASVDLVKKQLGIK